MHRIATLLPSLLLAACGCSPANSNPDMATTGDMTPAVDMTPSGVKWTVNVLDLQSMAPLSGVNVCIAPANQVCATTSASGAAVLYVPPSSQFLFSYSVANYAPQYTEHTTTATVTSDTSPYFMVSTTNENALATFVGKTLDPTKGHLVYSAIDVNHTPLAGVKFTQSPVVGDGPYYFSGALPSAAATSTSANGIGFVLNVPAGDYDVSATLTGKVCIPLADRSWPGSTASNGKAHAIAASLTTVSFICQ